MLARGWQIVVVVCLLLIGWFYAFSTAPHSNHSQSFAIFGSQAQIDFSGVSSQQAQQVTLLVEQRLHGLERDWHPWEESALQRLNADIAQAKPSPVVGSLQQLLIESRPLVRASDGLFDPALGGLVRLWGYHTSVYPITKPSPSARAIAAWLNNRPQLTDIVVAEGYFKSSHPGLQLDFNAIAEGAAIAQILPILIDAHVPGALINLGGDVYAYGQNGARGWRVGLRDAKGVLGVVELDAASAFFSSGNYSKYRLADGQRLAHVLDPRSGYPVQGSTLSAVMDSDPLLADAAATALLVAGESEFVRIARQLRIVDALLLTDNDTLLISSGLNQRLKLNRAVAKTQVVELFVPGAH